MPSRRDLRRLSAALVASVFFCQNCATIVSGTTKKIPVTSNPVGARVWADGEDLGFTPLNLVLKKNKDHLIRVEKPGYNPLEIRVSKKSSGSLAVSILGNGWSLGTMGFFAGLLIGAALQGDKSMSIQETFNILFLSPVLCGVAGTAIGVAVDVGSGAVYTLSPADLSLTLTRIESETRPEVIVLDPGRVQDIKWIRIKLADAGKNNEVFELNLLD